MTPGTERIERLENRVDRVAISALAPALGLTEEQVDSMFIQAESLAV
jgi:hypothetical protein